MYSFACYDVNNFLYRVDSFSVFFFDGIDVDIAGLHDIIYAPFSLTFTIKKELMILYLIPAIDYFLIEF